MKVAVVGLGLIGGSTALELKAAGFASEVIGVENQVENASLAQALNLVDRLESVSAAVKKADLVVLAIPVGAMMKVLPEVLSEISDSTTVVDMGSTKAFLCDLIRNHPRKAQFVPSHPMAGTENSGPRAAHLGLFARKVAVICDHGTVGTSHREKVEAMYGALGMKLIFMTPEEHDLHTAYVSHLSHISSFVLANTVLEKEKNVRTIFDLAGGGFESTVRLAKSSPAMWGPIFEQNRENVADALGTYIRQLQEFHRSLLEKNTHKTFSLMEEANRIRQVLDQYANRTQLRNEIK